MPIDWREEYAASLEDVEFNNTVNMQLVQTCPYHPNAPIHFVTR